MLRIEDVLMRMVYVRENLDCIEMECSECIEVGFGDCDEVIGGCGVLSKRRELVEELGLIEEYIDVWVELGYVSKKIEEVNFDLMMKGVSC